MKRLSVAKLTDRVWCGGAKLTELVVTKGWGRQHVGMELLVKELGRLRVGRWMPAQEMDGGNSACPTV